MSRHGKSKKNFPITCGCALIFLIFLFAIFLFANFNDSIIPQVQQTEVSVVTLTSVSLPTRVPTLAYTNTYTFTPTNTPRPPTATSTPTSSATITETPTVFITSTYTPSATITETPTPTNTTAPLPPTNTPVVGTPAMILAPSPTNIASSETQQEETQVEQADETSQTQQEETQVEQADEISQTEETQEIVISTDNLLLNSDFSNGTDNWNVSDESECFEVSDSQIKTMQIEEALNGDDVCGPFNWSTIYQDVDISQVGKFSVSVKMRGENMAEGHVKVEWFDANGDRILDENGSGFVLIAGVYNGTVSDWQVISTTIVAPESAVRARIMVLHGREAGEGPAVPGSTMYVDEICFAPSPDGNQNC